MNIGDKVIAVGFGRKTKELNHGDITRSGDRTPGFQGLAQEQVVMTVKEINGDMVKTPFYLFHKDDLHLVDTGRASVAIAPAMPEPARVSLDGEYTADELRAELDELLNS